MLYQTEYTHGGDIYSDPITLDFSASVNPFGPPPAVVDAMRKALPQAEHYPDPCCREAVRAISEYEGLPPEMILMGNGAGELIGSFCEAAGPRTALIPVPTFTEYEASLARFGCRIIRHPLPEENGFLPGEDLCEVLAENHPDAVFLCHPNNPTGRLIPKNLLKKILDLCSSGGIRIFLDECFLDFTDGGPDMKDQLTGHPGLFILKALTKNYALAGIRVGYALSADSALLRRMSQTVQPWNVSVIAQAAAAAAVKESGFLEETRKLISAERKWMTSELAAAGCRVCPSDANFILFRAPVSLGSKLRRMGIAIRDCRDFRGLEPGWYRAAVRQHAENEVLIRAMRQVMQETA